MPYKTILSLFIVGIFLIFPVSSDPIYPKRELRGAWIATVGNIDWPNNPNVSTADQQATFIALLDAHQKTGINTIFMQIRPATDAFYAKGRELWSYWLTGNQGQPPQPFYDPLNFFIKEAHKRGMELHAWFNPYRAIDARMPSPPSSKHIANKKPHWFFQYGKETLFNPGIPAVRTYIASVVMDVVRNYDIDGVHLDDYFYPYPIKKTPIPDQTTFERYGKKFKNNKEDWRRNNVNLLIQMLHKQIKQTKPYVKFGISPFAIWKNNQGKDADPEGSDTNAFTSYYGLYADTRLWLQKGWIDYLIPQVYFQQGHPRADFETLIDWWAKNAYGKHIYIGMSVYKIGSDIPAWQNPAEMPEQLRLLQAYQEDIQGQVYFNTTSLMNNPLGLTDSLKINFYKHPALLPEMPWVKNLAPASPQNTRAKKQPNGTLLEWKSAKKSRKNPQAWAYVIYRFAQNEGINLENATKIIAIVPQTTTYLDTTSKQSEHNKYVITALSRLHQESKPSNIILIDAQ